MKIILSKIVPIVSIGSYLFFISNPYSRNEQLCKISTSLQTKIVIGHLYCTFFKILKNWPLQGKGIFYVLEPRNILLYRSCSIQNEISGLILLFLSFFCVPYLPPYCTPPPHLSFQHLMQATIHKQSIIPSKQPNQNNLKMQLIFQPLGASFLIRIHCFAVQYNPSFIIFCRAYLYSVSPSYDCGVPDTKLSFIVCQDAQDAKDMYAGYRRQQIVICGEQPCVYIHE